MSNNLIILKTREEAITEINQIKSKLGLIDINNLCDEEVETEEQKLLTNTLINAVRLGLVYFDEESKGLVQKFIYPFKYNNNEIETIIFFKQLKIKNIKSIGKEEEINILLKNIAIITNEPVEKIEEINLKDYNITVAIYRFLYK